MTNGWKCIPGYGCFSCPLHDCTMGRGKPPTPEERKMRRCGFPPVQKNKPGKVPSYKKILY